MLIRIEHAFRRNQLHDLNLIMNGPAVRSRALAQFPLRLGQTDVDADLAVFGSRHQELQRDRCFSRAGAALEQVKPIAGQSVADVSLRLLVVLPSARPSKISDSTEE